MMAAQPSAEAEAFCWICLGGNEPENAAHCGGAQRASARGGAGAGGPAPAGPLEALCPCPGRLVHRRCLARWQLQCAGTLEEHACRFCSCALPGWRESLAASVNVPLAPPPPPRAGAGAGAPAPAPAPVGGAPPVIAVHLNGATVNIEVPPGCGLERFKAVVRRRLGLSPMQTFD
ncbi:hypothetical protein Rsub_00847 [Raphidocelis subcapitata]|uniref:RING-CH-type domain-containing protein n=1 Tax=Raphidocelis subcapitata TaxID=307507 RepID=A0A2V0NTH7_9CHLO|nr:hypothetical protein Rsub_00847 [Raphidocelis subcapitata]|eukprot:GBF88135.1 hypothetical protein Rsub_00847 [Raphidocelis subcapitata]